MRTIRKGPEPVGLTQYRLSENPSYEGYPDKDTLRNALVSEQRGLCCYCLSRIRADRESMKIEHWLPQKGKKGNETKQLSYKNLLGACKGNEGGPALHCDSSKGMRELSRNPANPEHRVEDLVHFNGDGKIQSPDPNFNTELNEVLNLNFKFLQSNRRDTLNAFTTAIVKRDADRSTLEKWLRTWNGESEAGDLRPYCQVVVYWLRKRLARP